MAVIRTYDDPFERRERPETPPAMPALDYKYTNGKRQTASPYASYTTPGYQPSAGGPAANPFQVQPPSQRDQDRIAGGMTGQPFGGAGAITPQTAQPFDINRMIAELQRYYPSGSLADLARAQQERPDLFSGGTLGGSKGEKFSVGGRTYDLINSAGLGGRGWQALDITPGANTFGGAQEFTDPLTSQYESLAKSRIDQLFNPLPEGPDTLSMADWLRKRSGELAANPGYSPGDRETIRTGYSDPLAAQRESAKQQVRERLAAQGIQGGLVERAMQEVDRNYDAMLAANNRQLATNEIGRRDQNLNEATELRQYLATAEQARQAFQEGRYNDAVALSEQLSRLPERRIQLANQTLSGGQSPSDLFSQLMNFGQAGDQSNYIRNQQNSQFWQSVFSVLGTILGGRR